METLDARLNRLRELLESTAETPRPPEGSAAPSDTAWPAVSARLPPLTNAIEQRVSAPEWDPIDAMTARLMLDELTTSLRSCRRVAREAAARLDGVARLIRHGTRLVSREISRQEKAKSSDAKEARN